MSGSIGANRIPTRLVKPTVDKYIETVLKKFPGFVSCDTTGSYNVLIKNGKEKKEGHGDIDLVIHIEHKDIKQLKKKFKQYCSELSDNITIPFKDGKRKGDKAQLFGSIVTIAFPIYSDEEKCVQIDNIIVTTEKDKVFQKSFLDMNAQKQALFQGVVRVLLQYENKEEIFQHFGIETSQQLDNNQEYEFVLSSAGLSCRLVTLTDDRKEQSRIEIWRSNDWEDVKWLMKNYNFDNTYEECLNIVAKRIIDERSRSRIIGIIKSMIHVGPGEINTHKGNEKLAFIKLVEDTLSIKTF